MTDPSQTDATPAGADVEVGTDFTGSSTAPRWTGRRVRRYVGPAFDGHEQAPAVPAPEPLVVVLSEEVPVVQFQIRPLRKGERSRGARRWRAGGDRDSQRRRPRMR